MPVLILQSIFDNGDEDDLGFWPNPQNEKNWTLRDVFEQKEWEIEDGTKTTAQIQLSSENDMGDGWDYEIVRLGSAGKGLHEVLGGRETLPTFSASSAKVICALKSVGARPGGRI